MKNKRSQKTKVSTYDVLKKERGTWGDISPVTKVVGDKTKDSKNQRKNKKKLIEKEMDGDY